MYFVAIEWLLWYDTVVSMETTGISEWDIVIDADTIFLCIGKNLSFGDLYTPKQAPLYTLSPNHKIQKKRLSKQTMIIIHRLVKQYYASYKTVANLYLDKYIILHSWPSKWGKRTVSDNPNQQTCIIFPDVWALTQIGIPAYQTDKTAILHGWMTVKQQNTIFQWVKNGSIETLLATNRWLFFDWHSLNRIIVYNPSDRAYSAKSEPRFVMSEVAKKVAEIYNAEVMRK